MIYGLPENPTREDVRREQDLKRVYLDFGIDSQGIFYRRIKSGQNLFEQTESFGETPEQIRNALENPFFFGGVINTPNSVSEEVKVPEGQFGVQTEDGKLYRDPRTPTQIVRGIISEASRNGLQTANLEYNNVAVGKENRGPENFQDRNDIINFAHQEPTMVDRTFATAVDEYDDMSFEAHVLDTDNPEALDYWSDINTDYISLGLIFGEEKYRYISLQRIVVGRYEWTEVSE